MFYLVLQQFSSCQSLRVRQQSSPDASPKKQKCFLPLVRSAVPIGEINGEMNGVWGKMSTIRSEVNTFLRRSYSFRSM